MSKKTLLNFLPVIVIVLFFLIGVFLFCQYNGVFYSLTGPRVILESFEECYSEKFIIYDSEKSRSRSGRVTDIIYYLYPENDDSVKFSVTYIGESKLDNMDLSSYPLAKEFLVALEKLKGYCIGAESVSQGDLTKPDVGRAYYDNDAYAGISWWNMPIDSFCSDYSFVVHYSSDYDKVKGFSELFTGLRELGLEFNLEEDCSFDVSLYFGEELYTVELDVYGRRYFSDYSAEELSAFPLGHNIVVILPNDDSMTEYNGAEFIEHLESEESSGVIVGD